MCFLFAAFFFGSLRSHPLLWYSRLRACSLEYCAFPACHCFHRLAALAHTLRVFLSACRHESYAHLLLVFCLLYFLRLAALAPTGHCQGIVGLGQVLWDAVPFLLAIFSFGSLRSHTLSKCFRLQALAFGFLLAIVFFGSLRSHPQGTLRVL